MKKILSAFFLFFSLFSLSQQRGSIEISVKNIKSSSGNIMVYLYNAENGFPKKKELSYKSKMLKARKDLQLRFENIPFGNYAVILFHDANGNKRMDRNWIGFPAEGYGLSNNVKPRFGPPRFKDAEFVLDTSLKTVKIQVRY